METTNSTPANETLLESAKMANKWFNDATTSTMESYKKQLNLVSGYYSNFFNSFLGENKNIWNPTKNFADLFFNNNDSIKSMFIPFSGFGMNGAFSNQFSNPFEKMIKQLTDYNQNLLGSFTKQFENGNSDWGVLNEKYQKTIEKEFEASKKLINTMVEGYNAQTESSLEAHKKLQEEINKQIGLVFKLNQEFWSEVLKTSQPPVALEKFSKDGAINDNKKQTKTSVNV
ncbi:MAG: hypothetical protein WCH21_11180 [Bacteroidota bacterium]